MRLGHAGRDAQAHLEQSRVREGHGRSLQMPCGAAYEADLREFMDTVQKKVVKPLMDSDAQSRVEVDMDRFKVAFLLLRP